MTALIHKQLTIIVCMAGCGLAVGLVSHTLSLFRKVFLKHGLSRGVAQVLGLCLIGWCTGEFLYYSSYGRITFSGTVSFFAGLWLWRRIQRKMEK